MKQYEAYIYERLGISLKVPSKILLLAGPISDLMTVSEIDLRTALVLAYYEGQQTAALTLLNGELTDNLTDHLHKIIEDLTERIELLRTL